MSGSGPRTFWPVQLEAARSLDKRLAWDGAPPEEERRLKEEFLEKQAKALAWLQPLAIEFSRGISNWR